MFQLVAKCIFQGALFNGGIFGTCVQNKFLDSPMAQQRRVPFNVVADGHGSLRNLRIGRLKPLGQK